MPAFEHVEILTLILGLLVLGFVLFERHRLVDTVGSRLLFWAFGLLLVSWTASVVEGVLLPDLLEWTQHLTASAAALLLLSWSVRFVGSRRGEEA